MKIKKLFFSQIKKILVIRKHNQIGDLIVSVPMFFALKKHFPDAQICLLASRTNYNIPFKEIIPYVDNVITFDRRTLKKQIDLIINLRKQKFDLALIPSTIRFSTTSIIVSYLSNIKYRVGLVSNGDLKNKFSFLLNIKSNFDWTKNKTHQIFRNLEFVEQINCKITVDEIFKSYPTISDQDNRKAKQLIEAKIGTCELIIGIHPGAGQIKNIWPYENFIQIINLLNQKYKCGFVITAGQIDNDILEKIIPELEKRKIIFFVASNYGFNELMALINQCDLFISNDTGVMHIAGLTDTRLIALMRKENEYVWRPLGRNKFYILSKTNEINDISVEEVLILSEKLIQTTMYMKKSN